MLAIPGLLQTAGASSGDPPAILLAPRLCLLASGGRTVALAGAPASLHPWLLLLERRNNVVSSYLIQPIESLAWRTSVAACCVHIQKHSGFPLKIAEG